MKAHNTKFMKYNRSNSYREIQSCKYINKKENFQINNLTFHFKKLEEQTESKTSRKKEIKIKTEMKQRGETDKIKNQKMVP